MNKPGMYRKHKGATQRWIKGGKTKYHWVNWSRYQKNKAALKNGKNVEVIVTVYKYEYGFTRNGRSGSLEIDLVGKYTFSGKKYSEIKDINAYMRATVARDTRLRNEPGVYGIASILNDSETTMGVQVTRTNRRPKKYKTIRYKVTKR